MSTQPVLKCKLKFERKVSDLEFALEVFSAIQLDQISTANRSAPMNFHFRTSVLLLLIKHVMILSKQFSQSSSMLMKSLGTFSVS